MSYDYNAYARDRYAINQVWLDALREDPCTDCGKNYPKECMEFDHTRGKKRENVGGLLNYTGVLQKEIEKCDLVCANCHAIRTHLRRKGNK